MNKVKRLISSAALTSFLAVQAFGADIADVDVKGCVKDRQSNEPLIGATVKVVGSSVGSFMVES